MIKKVQRDWDDHVLRILKSELVKKGISHKQLIQLLRSIGDETTKASVDNKLSRGTFSASFFCKCLSAIGCKSIDLE